MKNKQSPKKLFWDFIIVVVIIIIGAILSLVFRFKGLTSSLFFFFLPSFYLLCRQPKRLHRIFGGSFLIGTIFGFIFDFMANIGHAWAEYNSQLVFPYRILGVVPLDELIWYFGWVLVIVTFYEHFLEHERRDTISHNYKYGLLPALFTTASILVIYIVAPDKLVLGHTYLLLGLCTLVPFIYLTIKKPVLFIKFMSISPFFFFLFSIHEITALIIGQWYFPGRYIGVVSIGNLSFPFEEFFFWILMSSTIVLSYYELYVDDER
ncbi:MAG: hypothetical protein P4L74_06175 [Candidatus Doudnabacteria bacterium]|nr:hypothetical protein [Candidatus Doudnabacteria bacterium]